MQQLKDCVNYFSRLILSDIPSSCWIAGGALRDYFSLGYCASDIDVFFPSVNEFQKANNFFETKGLKPTFQNDRVTNYIWKKHKIQLITGHYFQSPEDTINAFDFTVACCAVDRERVYHHASFFIDLARKRLVINQLPYPLSTLQRMQKYIKYGYTICNAGLLSIAKAIQQVNLNNPSENTFEFYPDGKVRFMRID